MLSVRCTRLDTVGNRGFSGASTMPGADVWPGSETSRGLDPAGGMVRRLHSRHHTKANRDASAATRRGRVGQAEHTGKKVLQSCVRGMYCLLTGAFSWVYFLSAEALPHYGHHLWAARYGPLGG